MNTLESNKLLINFASTANNVVLYLSGNFTFDGVRVFKAAYKNYLEDSKIHNIVIDLEKIQYLDSSALEMLIVLREDVKLAGKTLILSKPGIFVQRVLEIANFDKLFVIN